MSRIYRYLDYFFYLPQWNVGTVDCCFDTVVQEGKLPGIRWWNLKAGAVFNADPFFIGDEVIFERMNRWRGKAELWIAKSDGSSARRLFRRGGHLSYPCVTELNGRTFLVYEASSTGTCTILERQGERWQAVASIGQPIVDGTLLYLDNLWWLFGTLADGTENSALHIWWADAVEGPWRPHELNPVKRDVASSRPAGRIQRSKLGLIRPAQDCSATYGGGIVFCRVEKLDERTFEEVILCRLQPTRQYPHGVHTINSNSGGNTLIIDGKRTVFHPLAAFLKWKSRSHLKSAPRPDNALTQHASVCLPDADSTHIDIPDRWLRDVGPSTSESLRH